MSGKFYLKAVDGSESKNHHVANLDLRPDPNKIHRVLISAKCGSRQALPVEKTQEEIDRMWEYLKMMGRSQ